MTKSELIAQIAERSKAGEKPLTQVEVRVAYDLLTEVIRDEIVKPEVTEVSLDGLGKFAKVERAQRNGRNPKTGEALVIPAKIGLKFKVSSTLKNLVKSSS